MGDVHKVIENCSECVALLGDYLEGSLPAERAAALEKHLSLCMPCITFVRTYKKTTVIAREVLAAEMPPVLVSSLQQFLKGQIPGFKCDGKSDCSGDAAEKAKLAKTKPDPKS